MPAALHAVGSVTICGSNFIPHLLRSTGLACVFKKKERDTQGRHPKPLNQNSWMFPGKPQVILLSADHILICLI